MNEAAIRKQILEMRDTIRNMPEGGADSEGIYQPEPGDHKRENTDLLDALRMQLKYLIFDLEATRRENRYLRQMLDMRNRTNTDDDLNGPSDF